MSNVIEIEAEDIDEAICVSMLYFQTQAPIAVYDTEEKASLSFPYNVEKVDEILSNIWERLRDVYASIKTNPTSF